MKLWFSISLALAAVAFCGACGGLQDREAVVAPTSAPPPPTQAYLCDECVPAPAPDARVEFASAGPIDQDVIASLAAAMGHRRVELHPPVVDFPDGRGALAVVSIDVSDPAEDVAEMWTVQTELWRLAMEDGTLRRIDAIPTVQGVPVSSTGRAADCYSIARAELEDHDNDDSLELLLEVYVGSMDGPADEHRYARIYSMDPLRVAFERRLDWSEYQEGQEEEVVARTAMRWVDDNNDGHPDIELRTEYQTCPDDCVRLGDTPVVRETYRESSDGWGIR